MIETRQKTVTVYVVNGEEYKDRSDAIEAALVRALGGYLKGTRSSITVAELVRALSEPAVRFSIREIIDAQDSEKKVRLV